VIPVYLLRDRDHIVNEPKNPFPCPTSLEGVLLRELAAIGRRCYDRGWCPGTSGNFSLRGSRGVCWVSRTSICKASLGPNDFVPVSIDTGDSATPASPRASLEAAVHLAIYRLRDDARVVVHAHSPATVARSSGNLGLKFRGSEIQKALGSASHLESLDIPLIANPPAITLGEMVAALQHMDNLSHGVVVLRGHGTYAWGESPQGALDRLEALEFLCQTSP
jgi:ribulose-5-phosphate 4-epimerase/fuculose-1-phosphate aldolase